MKFRTYQLLFIAVIALLVAAMFMPIAQFVEPNGATTQLGNFSLTNSIGNSSYVVCALGVILSFTSLVNLFGLFVSLFNNFELQKRVSILSTLLLAGYYILLLVIALVLGGDNASVSIDIAMLLPFIAIVLDVMCFMSIRRTEAKILAKASGFRLRD